MDKSEFITFSPPWYYKGKKKDEVLKAEIAPRNDIEQLARAAALMRYTNQLKVSPKLLLAQALKESRRDYGMKDRYYEPAEIDKFYPSANGLAGSYGLPLPTTNKFKMPRGEWLKMKDPNYFTIAPNMSDALLAIDYFQHKLGERKSRFGEKVTPKPPKESWLDRWTGSGSAAQKAERKTQLIKQSITDPQNQDIRNLFNVYYNNIATKKPWLYPVVGGAR